MFFKEAISHRIYELCDKYHYTPNRLAELSAIPPTTLQDMLALRVNNPSSYVIYQICKTLNITLKDFFDSEVFFYIFYIINKIFNRNCFSYTFFIFIHS